MADRITQRRQRILRDGQSRLDRISAVLYKQQPSDESVDSHEQSTQSNTVHVSTNSAQTAQVQHILSNSSSPIALSPDTPMEEMQSFMNNPYLMGGMNNTQGAVVEGGNSNALRLIVITFASIVSFILIILSLTADISLQDSYFSTDGMVDGIIAYGKRLLEAAELLLLSNRYKNNWDATLRNLDAIVNSTGEEGLAFSRQTVSTSVPVPLVFLVGELLLTLFARNRLKAIWQDFCVFMVMFVMLLVSVPRVYLILVEGGYY